MNEKSKWSLSSHVKVKETTVVPSCVKAELCMALSVGAASEHNSSGLF